MFFDCLGIIQLILQLSIIYIIDWATDYFIDVLYLDKRR